MDLSGLALIGISWKFLCGRLKGSSWDNEKANLFIGEKVGE